MPVDWEQAPALRLEFIGCPYTYETTTVSELTTEQPWSESTPSYSTEPLSESTPITSTEPSCQGSWTEWMSSSYPSPVSMGEFETLENLRKKFDFCGPEMITDIQCHTVSMDMDYRAAFQNEVECSTTVGLVCYNNKQAPIPACYDYKVRFFCACQGTEKPSAAPTVESTTRSVVVSETTVVPGQTSAGPEETTAFPAASTVSVVKTTKVMGSTATPPVSETQETPVTEYTGPVQPTHEVQVTTTTLTITSEQPMEGTTAGPEGTTKKTYTSQTETTSKSEPLHTTLAGLTTPALTTAFPSASVPGSTQSPLATESVPEVTEVTPEESTPLVEHTTRKVVVMTTEQPSKTTVTTIIKTTTVTSPSGYCDEKMGIELGLENPNVPEHSLTASSSEPDHSPDQGRLSPEEEPEEPGEPGYWSPEEDRPGEYLEIQFEEPVEITSLTTQGGGDEGFVTRYKVAYSVDGEEWTFVTEPGTEEGQEPVDKLFEGNTDGNTPVTTELSEPVEAKLVRIFPEDWEENILFEGNTDGTTPVTTELSEPVEAKLVRIFPEDWEENIALKVELNTEETDAPEPTFSASSSELEHLPEDARLTPEDKTTPETPEDKTTPGSPVTPEYWSPVEDRPGEYLEVQFKEPVQITSIVTQGGGDDGFVTRYKVAYSVDGEEWTFVTEPGTEEGQEPVDKLFEGNTDGTTPVTSDLSEPVEAKLVRIFPEDWEENIALKVELNTEETEAPEPTFSASSSEPEHLPEDARLTPEDKTTPETPGGKTTPASPEDKTTPATEATPEYWSPVEDRPGEYLEVQFKEPVQITSVVTQGGEEDGFVTRYKVAYSVDGEEWTFVTEPGTEEGQQPEELIFDGNTDGTSVAESKLPEPVVASLIRLYPEEWENAIALRIELRGCPLGKQEIATTNFIILRG
ncbi:uncharacterized protein LOC144928728 [Branchiostoma floridae x Branchiostoma belcheri]